jgi:hypothetical protein
LLHFLVSLAGALMMQAEEVTEPSQELTQPPTLPVCQHFPIASTHPLDSQQLQEHLSVTAAQQQLIRMFFPTSNKAAPVPSCDAVTCGVESVEVMPEQPLQKVVNPDQCLTESKATPEEADHPAPRLKRGKRSSSNLIRNEEDLAHASDGDYVCVKTKRTKLTRSQTSFDLQLLASQPLSSASAQKPLGSGRKRAPRITRRKKDRASRRRHHSTSRCGFRTPSSSSEDESQGKSPPRSSISAFLQSDPDLSVSDPEHSVDMTGRYDSIDDYYKVPHWITPTSSESINASGDDQEINSPHDDEGVQMEVESRYIRPDDRRSFEILETLLNKMYLNNAAASSSASTGC